MWQVWAQGEGGPMKSLGLDKLNLRDQLDHVERAGRQAGIYAPGVQGEAWTGSMNLGTFKSRRLN